MSASIADAEYECIAAFWQYTEKFSNSAQPLHVGSISTSAQLLAGSTHILNDCALLHVAGTQTIIKSTKPLVGSAHTFLQRLVSSTQSQYSCV
jgi:hypothetical protein